MFMNHMKQRAAQKKAAHHPSALTRTAAVFVSLAFAGTILLSGCNAQVSAHNDDKLNIVTSFYPMYDFTKKIAGDHANVVNLVPAGTEPHDWEPTASDVETIKNADLFVYNGAGMESWVHDTLESFGNDAPAEVEASQGVELLAGHHHHHHHGDDHDHDHDGEAAGDEHDHDHDAKGEDHEHEGEEHGHDHDHGAYDPHVWLSPKNAKKELENIKDALVKVDPKHKDDYESNYKKFAEQFDQLDKDFSEKLSAVPNKTIVVSHEAFGYLAQAYGLKQIPITGMDAEGEPDAKTMAGIIDQVKAQGVKVIFGEELVSQKVAQAIADSTGAECRVLNPLEGLSQDELDKGADYLSVMHENLDELVKALS